MAKTVGKFRLLLKQLILWVYQAVPDRITANYINHRVTILLYHEIDPVLFASHIEYISANYNIISLMQFKQALYSETDHQLPERSLVITIDDGWKSNYELLPVIKKTSVPLTIFLTTGLIGTNRKIWNYTIDRSGKELDLNSKLKQLSNAEKNQILYKKNGYYPEKEYSSRDFLSLNEIDEMSACVDFQSHGIFHAVYPMCSDDELFYEMSRSKNKLEQLLGGNCYAIAYPYGRYGDREVKYAKQIGYSIARTASDPGINSVKSDPYRLKCVNIPEHASVKNLKEAIRYAEIKSLLNLFS